MFLSVLLLFLCTAGAFGQSVDPSYSVVAAPAAVTVTPSANVPKDAHETSTSSTAHIITPAYYITPKEDLERTTIPDETARANKSSHTSGPPTGTDNLAKQFQQINMKTNSTSIKYLLKDKLCNDAGGHCEQTSECYNNHGRPVEEFSKMCGGPISRVCCFPEDFKGVVTFHLGPLDNLSEHLHNLRNERTTSKNRYERERDVHYHILLNEDTCGKHHGKCKDTSECYAQQGRTVKEAVLFCEGSVKQQCCFPNQHPHRLHIGPLDKLSELSRYRQTKQILNP